MELKVKYIGIPKQQVRFTYRCHLWGECQDLMNFVREETKRISFYKKILFVECMAYGFDL